MDAAVQAFKDKMAEKAEAKAKVMAAVAVEDWDTVAEYGINGGTEGACMQALQDMADAYVKANPGQFTAAQTYANPDGLESIVKLIDLYRDAGMEEEALKLAMFELASFERQEIGTAAKAKLRLGNGD